MTTTLPPLDPDDLGTDVALTDDLAPVWGLASGKTNLAMALYRRLTTTRGSLFYDFNYGYNVIDLLNAELTPADLSAARGSIIAECEKDERVDSATAGLLFNPTARTLDIAVEVQTALGPFDLVLRASAVTVDILRLAGQDLLPAATRPDAVVVEVVRGGGGGDDGGSGLSGIAAVGSPVLWLETDSGLVLDGSNQLLSWTDKTSAHRIVAPLGPELFTLTPSVFSAQPGIVAPSLTGAKLQGADKLLPTNGARTVFVIFKGEYQSGGDEGRSWHLLSFGLLESIFALSVQNVHGNGTTFGYYESISDPYFFSPSKQTSAHPPSTFSIPRLLIFRFTGAGKIQFAVDNEVLTDLTGADYVGERGDAGFTIGGLADLSSFKVRGSYGAIVAHQGALSDSDVGAWRAYLMGKYL